MLKILAVVGMPGSGKSEAVQFLVKRGFHRVYFGDVIFDYMKKHNLKINERNEDYTRGELRRKHGMDVMAKLSAKKVTKALRRGNVVIESMYGTEEYLFLKKRYGKNFFVLAIFASPKIRYARLTKRAERPLKRNQCEPRDLSELRKTNKGGQIALADFTIINEGTLKDLKSNIEKVMKKL